MWPFKSKIPEIETMQEDIDGNIEINHSHGQFKINSKDIVDVQLTKNLSNYLGKQWFPWFTWFPWILGFPLTFLVGFILLCYSIRSYNHINIIELLFFSILLLLCCTYVTLLFWYLHNYYSSKYDVIKIITAGNSFQYIFEDEGIFRSISRFEKLYVPSIKKNIIIETIIPIGIVSIPIMAFLINWNDYYWFWDDMKGMRFFRSIVPASSAGYEYYYFTTTKGFFELFFDGLANIGGTIFFLFCCILLFLWVLIYVLFSCCIVLTQVTILPLIISFYLIRFTNKRMKDFDQKWSDDTFNFFIMRPILMPLFFISGSYPRKSLKFTNIIIWLIRIVFPIIVAVSFDFFLRDLIYYPLKENLMGLKIFFYDKAAGGSLFQFEKTIYFSLILFCSYFTFIILTPKKTWEEIREW